MCERINISIIIPVYDEQDNILILSEEIEQVMHELEFQWECIWINDGSTDESEKILIYLTQESKNHFLYSFDKNYGQSAAILAGIELSRGNLIILLDADGQNDPRDIPEMIKIIEEKEVDVVIGKRKVRKDNLVKRYSSLIANIITNLFLDTTCSDTGCSMKVFKKHCVKYLPRFKGVHRFINHYFLSQSDMKVLVCEVNHRSRYAGYSKYGVRNRLFLGLYDLFGYKWIIYRSIDYKIKKYCKINEYLP